MTISFIWSHHLIFFFFVRIVIVSARFLVFFSVALTFFISFHSLSKDVFFIYIRIRLNLILLDSALLNSSNIWIVPHTGYYVFTSLFFFFGCGFMKHLTFLFIGWLKPGFLQILCFCFFATSLQPLSFPCRKRAQSLNIFISKWSFS